MRPTSSSEEPSGAERSLPTSIQGKQGLQGAYIPALPVYSASHHKCPLCTVVIKCFLVLACSIADSLNFVC